MFSTLGLIFAFLLLQLPPPLRAGNLEPRDAVPAGYVAAPYYPTPLGGWASSWTESYSKAADLVKNLTLAEKVNLTTGTGLYMGPCSGNTGSIPRLNINNLCLQDGSLGIRATQNITAFPPGITVGATWNKELMSSRGVALGQEFRGKGINVALAPVVGPLGRKPRGGRIWEGFGADPVLQAVGGSLVLQGIQSQGVIATIKHFIGNEQEMFRMYNPFQPAYSANIDDRTMHELYLWPFAAAIEAGVGALMVAYNAVNGSACTQNSYLLNGLLKDELGFQGFAMSDWLAQIGGVSAALAGLDMDMPGDGAIPLFGDSYWMSDLTTAVLNASLPVSRLDDMVTRILAAWYQMGQDNNYPTPNFSANTDDPTGLCYPGALSGPTCVVNEYVNVEDDHAELAREVATEAVTLLMNENAAIPLSNSSTLFVFGTDAGNNSGGLNSCSDQGCDNGYLGMGWGSGSASYPFADAPVDALKAYAKNVTYYDSDTYPSGLTPTTDDIALVFINADSGENYITVEGNPGDRTVSNLNAWHNGDALVEDAARQFSTVIVIIHTVGPIILDAWIGLPSVKAVVNANLPGQAAGTSLAPVLFGIVSPSGHLPYTIPRSESQYPASVGLVYFELGQPQDTYTEGLYIDYRYFDKNNITPRYAFGHGLSYTNFSYTDATIKSITEMTSVPPAASTNRATIQSTYSQAIPPASQAIWPLGFNGIWRYLYPWLTVGQASAAVAASTIEYPYPQGYSTVPHQVSPASGEPGGNPALWDVAYNVSVKVTNTGLYSGKAVAQLYVSFPSGISYDTPVKQLRDFAKTDTLAPGDSQVLEMSVTRKDLSVWDVVSQNWVIPSISGSYTLSVGAASDDLRLTCSTSGSCTGGS